MGFHVDSGFWAFSPSPIKNADFVWDISDWTFEEVVAFMQLGTDMERMERIAGSPRVGVDGE